MNYEKLKKVVSDKGVTLNDLCQHIDMTESGFHAAVKNNSLKVKTIELIADYLNISVSNFFDENYNNLDTIKKTPKTEKQAFSSDVVDELRATVDILKQQNEFLQDLVKQSFQSLNNKLDKLGKHNGIGVSQQKELFEVAA